MTPEELAAIRERCEAATNALSVAALGRPLRMGVTDYQFARVGASASDVPALLAEVGRLRAVVGRVQKIADQWNDGGYGDHGYPCLPYPDGPHVRDELNTALGDIP